MQSISKFHGFLKHANGGNASGSGLKTTYCIFRGHPSNGDHRNRYRTANGRQAINSLRGPVIGFGRRVENRAKVNIVRAGSTPIRKSGFSLREEKNSSLNRQASETGIPFSLRWTPPAPLASATSSRSFTKIRHELPTSAIRCNDSTTSSSHSLPEKSFSRNWIQSTPAAAARSTLSNSNWCASVEVESGRLRRSVT